jgi:hypothetical protein
MKDASMEIKILGPGCPRCHDVEKRTFNALADLNLAADVVFSVIRGKVGIIITLIGINYFV